MWFLKEIQPILAKLPPQKDEIRKFLVQGGGEGVKRTFSGGKIDDNPRKRINLNNIIVRGGGVDIETNTVDRAEFIMCLKNATPSAGPITDQDLVIICNWTEEIKSEIS